MATSVCGGSKRTGAPWPMHTQHALPSPAQPAHHSAVLKPHLKVQEGHPVAVDRAPIAAIQRVAANQVERPGNGLAFPGRTIGRFSQDQQHAVRHALSQAGKEVASQVGGAPLAVCSRVEMVMEWGQVGTCARLGGMCTAPLLCKRQLRWSALKAPTTLTPAAPCIMLACGVAVELVEAVPVFGLQVRTRKAQEAQPLCRRLFALLRGRGEQPPPTLSWRLAHATAPSTGPCVRAIALRKPLCCYLPYFRQCLALPPHLSDALALGLPQGHEEAAFLPIEAGVGGASQCCTLARLIQAVQAAAHAGQHALRDVLRVVPAARVQQQCTLGGLTGCCHSCGQVAVLPCGAGWR